MTIKASEKLRECANHPSAGFFVNLESQFGVSRYWCGDHVIKPSSSEIFNAIADEIDREVAEIATLGGGTCKLEETESYPSENGWVHVLECSNCGKKCEHVNDDYEHCPHCLAKNELFKEAMKR